MAGEGNYHKALANNKRRLKDYQEVHFRRSSLLEERPSRVPSPQNTSIRTLRSGSIGTRNRITLAPRRTSRAQTQLEGHFNPSTASLYLRQNEGVWLCPHLSRQEATASLFDRPIGTFIVRNSQKARYALSVRAPKGDLAVSHYLIEANQQGFLTIQGSNLPFLSIYDLLAYFCFYKSGGMPCYLAQPVAHYEQGSDGVEQDSFDSSDSDDDDINQSESSLLTSASLPASSPPPLVPPHRSSVPGRPHSRSMILPPVHEEIFIDSQKQSQYVKTMKERLQKSSSSTSPPPPPSSSPSPPPPPPMHRSTRKPPPPKPPRGSSLLDDDVFPLEEAKVALRKVDSIVDVDTVKLYHNYRKISKKGKKGGKEEKEEEKKKKKKEEEGGGGARVGVRKIRLQRKMSWSSEDLRQTRRNVNSLVKMFENGEERSSPPLLTVSWSHPHSNPKVTQRENSAPLLPPRPSRPSLPPKPTSVSGTIEPPMVPPHTPAPIIPPRPSGSRAPFVPARERSSSDSTYSGKPRPPAPPPDDPTINLTPHVMSRDVSHDLRPAHYEFDQELRERLAVSRRDREKRPDSVEGAKNLMNRLLDPGPEERRENEMAGVSVSGIVGGETERERDLVTSTSSEGPTKERSKSRRIGWAKKLPNFYRKPRKKLRKFIVDLASDPSTEFGQKMKEFVSDIKSRSKEPYQKILSEVRNFMTLMHDYLLQNHLTDLVNSGLESCENSEHVIETSLQQCVLGPLSLYVYLGIEEHLMETGSLFQVQRSVHQGKNRTPQEMGIRENLAVPSDKAVAEISSIFSRMTKTYCAISKLEFLLEAVRLTYENVKDSKNPKKTMNDLGADDFLPLFVWVLVQSGFTRAEIEAEYMWGLAHPSLFNGEAGYYLTTLTSAINVLKETQPAVPAFPSESEESIEEQIQNLPCMNNLQTELKIFFEDASTGQYSSAYRLPVVPDMTVAEVCEIIGQKHCKTNPERYGLFTVVDGQVSEMDSEEKPQEVKKRWALEQSSTTGGRSISSRQPSTRFMAYRLKQSE